MEGKKRKRKELSLKTSKKQALWKADISGGYAQTEQDPPRASEVVHLETREIGVCKNTVDAERATPITENNVINDDLRFQLKALLPMSQRWEDLEDLPESVSEENTARKQTKYLHQDQDENQQIGEQAKCHDKSAELDGGYTDLPKSDVSCLSSTKPCLLDVEHILKSCAHNMNSMDSHKNDQNYSASDKGDSAISRRWSLGGEDCLESVSSLPTQKNKEEKRSRHSHFSNTRSDVVDLTKDSPFAGGTAVVTENFQSRSGLAGRNSAKCDVSSKNSFIRPSNRELTETKASIGSNTGPRFGIAKSSLQFGISKNTSSKTTSSVSSDVQVLKAQTSRARATGDFSSAETDDCASIHKHEEFRRVKSTEDVPFGDVGLGTGRAVERERIKQPSSLKSSLQSSKDRNTNCLNSSSATSIPGDFRSRCVNRSTSEANNHQVTKKKVKAEKSGLEQKRSCLPTEVTSSSLVTSSTCGTTWKAEQLKCCPMCLCNFSPGTSKRHIDQHISICVESGAIMDDDDEW